MGGWQAIAVLATLGLLPGVLSATGWGLAGALLFWSGHLALQAYELARGLGALRQLRLEARFVQQRFSPELLRTCLERDDHLWAGSLSLSGLRQLNAFPMGRALPKSVQAMTARQRLRHALLPLLPKAVRLSAVMAGLLTLLAVAAGWTANGLGATSVVSLLISTAMAHALLEPLHRRHEHLVHALSRWALELDQAMPAPPSGEVSYEHTLLYRARPWLASAPQRESSF